MQQQLRSPDLIKNFATNQQLRQLLINLSFEKFSQIEAEETYHAATFIDPRLFNQN
jgi:hypothetical protein